MTKTVSFDITIVGGGLVGTLLAIALKDSPWRIALIEAYVPAQHSQAAEDMRSIALSENSCRLLEKYHLWQDIQNFATPIEKIHVSEQKRFGKTVLDAKELELPPFAHVVPIPCLYQALQKKLAAVKNMTIMRPACLTDIQKNAVPPFLWDLEVNNQKISTQLLIAADGERSFIRDTLKLPVEKTEYHQTAVVTTARISRPHENMAYERFTPLGVLALLPLQDQRVAVIWTVGDDNKEKISQHILLETQTAIGYRLGKFSQFGRIQHHSLKELHTDIQTQPGLFLIGNAAHVLHPVAAQGFNLSVRDVSALIELLLSTSDLNDPYLSENYMKMRRKDQQDTENFTDKLVKLFTPQFLPVSLMRSLGLLAFDLIPPAKRMFCLKRMGFV
jgi:2-octaprenyl-6-methoxyphenol hydroxylase